MLGRGNAFFLKKKNIGWAEFFFLVQNFAFRFLIVFPFFFSFCRGVQKNVGMKMFVDIFGVTSKMEFFMGYFLKSTTGICVF